MQEVVRINILLLNDSHSNNFLKKKSLKYLYHICIKQSRDCELYDFKIWCVTLPPETSGKFMYRISQRMYK